MLSETTSESVEENRFSDEGMETEIEVTPDVRHNAVEMRLRMSY